MENQRTDNLRSRTSLGIGIPFTGAHLILILIGACSLTKSDLNSIRCG